MADGDILQLPPTDDGTSRRLVLPGGFSRTLKGVLKIAVGIVLKSTGWALSAADQNELVSGLMMLVGLALDCWGMGQIYVARQSRGDLSVIGQRVKPVETVVLADVKAPLDQPEK